MIGNISFCEMQTFLTYNLGLRQNAGLRAEQGTVVHKVMEVIAHVKQKIQQGAVEQFVFEDEHLGNIDVDVNTYNKPYKLSDEEVDEVNKTMVNKSVYKDQPTIKYGHVRHGVEFVESVLDLAYDHYRKKSVNDWKPITKKECRNFTWLTLDYNNGIFDPRRQNIIQAEQHFDFEIEHDWAKYEFDLEEGKIEGRLALKGTIDLITWADEKEGIIEIIDYKTGQRKDWATDRPKDYEYLCSDKQLMLYFYAARKLYPKAKSIILTIFFIRDGGPYSICFSEEDVERIEEMLKERFEYIRECNTPKMQDPFQKNFKCTAICDYYKMRAGNTNICKFIHDKIQRVGIDQVITEHKDPEFKIGTYEAPGE
jgi:hypothetical protein